jgi:hypothetical protein
VLEEIVQFPKTIDVHSSTTQVPPELTTPEPLSGI